MDNQSLGKILKKNLPLSKELNKSSETMIDFPKNTSLLNERCMDERYKEIQHVVVLSEN